MPQDEISAGSLVTLKWVHMLGAQKSKWALQSSGDADRVHLKLSKYAICAKSNTILG